MRAGCDFGSPIARSVHSSSPVQEAPAPGTKPDRQALKDELLEVAKQVRAIPSFSLLMIDTENKFVSTGLAKEIAELDDEAALNARLMSSKSLARSADAYISPDVKRPPIEANNE